MKKDTHPEFNKETKVTCACGSAFTVGSILKEINVEVCSDCHPFFTGKEKVMDTAGRVEKFKARQQAASQLRQKPATKTKKTDNKKENSQTEDSKVNIADSTDKTEIV
ncbi:MAG: 50S ribosomal protein L31 [Patescibacteria group bacterium]